jgi:pimeloyl-ACP methyl ester carboxylesterase
MLHRTVDDVIAEHRVSGKFFEVEGLRTFALDAGQGEAVLCLHGVPTSSFLYRKLIAELARRGMRGIAIDLPGLGLTDRPESFDYSFSGLAQFCNQAVQELGLKAYHLVVHDIGGPIGFALAAQKQEQILSLTILNSWIEVDKFKKPLPMRPFELPVLGEMELASITHLSWRLVFRLMAVLDAAQIPPAEIDAYVDLLKREDGGRAFLKIMRSFEQSLAFRNLCRRAVQQVPYPVQAIWGVHDPGLRYGRYGDEVRRIAGLEKVHLVPARHLLQEEQWKAIADKLVDIARLSRKK